MMFVMSITASMTDVVCGVRDGLEADPCRSRSVKRQMFMVFMMVLMTDVRFVRNGHDDLMSMMALMTGHRCLLSIRLETDVCGAMMALIEVRCFRDGLSD